MGETQTPMTIKLLDFEIGKLDFSAYLLARLFKLLLLRIVFADSNFLCYCVSNYR